MMCNSFSRFLIILTLLFNTAIALAQTDTAATREGDKKEVEIVNADLLRFIEIEGKKYTRLVGNVQLKQDQVTMFCDSATLSKDSNSLDAYGHIHIENDTINAYSKFLRYDGSRKILTLKQDAYLTDNKMKLVSDELYYNTRDKIAYYLTGGKVYREKSTIKSRYGYYYSQSSDIYFNQNVDITDPDYHLTSDTLKYNVKTDVATFFGNTIIDNKSSKIYCNNGWFDTKQNVASFGLNTKVVDGAQTLYADSLYYERFRSYGRAYKQFKWIDTSMAAEIQGRQGEYYDERQLLKAYDHAFMIYKMEKDSLFLSGDTLKSMNNSATDTTKNFYVYYHVKLFMKDMKGACDSLRYSFADSTFRMHYKPVLWADSTQMTGDSIFLRIKGKQAEKLSLLGNGFLVMPSAAKFYDQIKGKNIYGYFKENDLEKMFVDGNAESIYYGKDEKGKYMGANRSKCISMWMHFHNKKVSKVVFIQKPEAVFTPMKLLTEEDKKLLKFNWQIERKPKSREEVMRVGE